MPTIATNTSANSALTHLNKNSRDQDKSLAKLSSGSRIVSASDDAAGLAVSSSLSADIVTLKQAYINTVQARSVLQTADGALARVADILQRQKALATQSISGSIDNPSRLFLHAEFQRLKAEILAIGSNTRFNGTLLLDSNYNATNNIATFQVGIAVTDTIVADLTTVNITAAGLPSTGGFIFVSSALLAINASPLIDTDINTVSANRSTIGALLSRFEYRGDINNDRIENLESARSSILDVDLAAEQTNLVSKQVLTEAAIAALSQANQMKSSLLSLIR